MTPMAIANDSSSPARPRAHSDFNPTETAIVWPVAVARAEAKRVGFADSVGLCDSEDKASPKANDTTIRRRRSPAASMDDTYLRELIGSASPPDSPAARSIVRRSQSCGVQSRPRGDSNGSYRLKIGYSDENLRERCERNTQQLLQTALDDAVTDTNSAILARKALRYRKILQRMEETNVDVSDPKFDVSACLGVRWHRVESE